MYRVWYWAMIDRESDGCFIASIPDLGDLTAYGDTDKDAVRGGSGNLHSGLSGVFA
jgi:predicted RNase H-like HicB family nuclease